MIQLQPELVTMLQDRIEAFQNESDWRTRKQISVYLNTFRELFGPDSLQKLRGEELLNHMHKSRGSLMYWLEFKNDEEFPTNWFGSIGGGSALKFNVYFAPEAEAWFKRSEAKAWQKQEIDVEEAITIAEEHREQVLAACEIMEKLPLDGTQDDYNHLQDQLEQSSPNVVSLAWFHKYLNLLYPEKLDDFQTLDYKKHYLTRLLLDLPQPAERYTLAWPFVELSKQFDLLPTQFTHLLGKSFGDVRRYWRIGAGTNDEPERFWEQMQSGSYVALGYDDIGDLSEYTISEPDVERIKELFRQREPQKDPRWEGRLAHAFKRFIWTVREGDVIVASSGTEILGIGEVSEEPYTFAEKEHFGHRRSVNWKSLHRWSLPTLSEQPRAPFYPLNKETNQLAIERHLFEHRNDAVVRTLSPRKQTSRLSIRDQLSPDELRIYTRAKEKGQIVLYGPPGTGKTYWAQRTALNVAALESFGERFENLKVEQQKQLQSGNDRIGQVVQATFHPSYGYEDFIEGYRPKVGDDGQLIFGVENGLFIEVCKNAEKYPSKTQFLIIDEINRGDLPRIFGELLTLLEKDKRNSPIHLAYTREPFTIPENVFIIGTMNTADQSIALLDTALRRRFSFIEFLPDGKILGDATVGKVRLSALLKQLNHRIREKLGNNGRERQIGHAYFMREGQPVENPKYFVEIIEHDIIPLLMEYCYGDFPLLAEILTSSLVGQSTQTINYDLLRVERIEELVTQLMGRTIDQNETDDEIGENHELNDEPEIGEDENQENQ